MDLSGGTTNAVQPERPTLMMVVAILEERTKQLAEVAGMTQKLHRKLNRTDNEPLGLNDAMKKDTPHRTLVELFIDITDKMQYEIDVIGKNTQQSLDIIE